MGIGILVGVMLMTYCNRAIMHVAKDDPKSKLVAGLCGIAMCVLGFILGSL